MTLVMMTTLTPRLTSKTHSIALDNFLSCQFLERTFLDLGKNSVYISTAQFSSYGSSEVCFMAAKVRLKTEDKVISSANDLKNGYIEYELLWVLNLNAWVYARVDVDRCTDKWTEVRVLFHNQV